MTRLPATASVLMIAGGVIGAMCVLVRETGWGAHLVWLLMSALFGVIVSGVYAIYAPGATPTARIVRRVIGAAIQRCRDAFRSPSLLLLLGGTYWLHLHGLHVLYAVAVAVILTLLSIELERYAMSGRVPKS